MIASIFFILCWVELLVPTRPVGTAGEGSRAHRVWSNAFSNGDASASNSSHNSRNLLMGNETFFIGENKIALLL
jgi:hypothetical protein